MHDTAVFRLLLQEVERQLHLETRNPEQDARRLSVLAAYAQEIRQLQQPSPTHVIVVNAKK